MIRLKRSEGFTLVELMIAMALFSFILLFAVNAFIQVNRIYMKGVTLKRMNDQARTIVVDLTSNLQQSNGVTQGVSGSTHWICLGSLGVAYVWSSTAAGDFQKGNYDVCSSSSKPDLSGTTQNLIDGNTIVRHLNVDDDNDADLGVAKIDLVLSTKEESRLNIDDSDPSNTTYTCKGTSGDQYCGVVKLSTVVRMPSS